MPSAYIQVAVCSIVEKVSIPSFSEQVCVTVLHCKFCSLVVTSVFWIQVGGNCFFLYALLNSGGYSTSYCCPRWVIQLRIIFTCRLQTAFKCLWRILFPAVQKQIQIPEINNHFCVVLAYLGGSVDIDYFATQDLDILMFYLNSTGQKVLCLLAFRVGNDYKRWSGSMFA